MLRALMSLSVSLVLLACTGCRFGSSAPDVRGYTLVHLKTGARTQLSKEESQTIFAGHFANMTRLAKEGKLLLAGPFGKEKHDEALRGLFVLATDDANQARAWAETDPGFQAQVFTLEYHPLATQAALHALLAQELARMDADEKAGRHPEPGEWARPYVLLTAEKGAAMERELAGQPFALLRGRLEGGRGWAVLDAPDRNAAAELLGVAPEKMGAVELDDWFATRGLEQLPTLVD